MRTLLIIFALLVAFTIIKRLINNRSRSKTINNNSTSSNHETSGNSATPDYKDTVQCSYCGTHLPSAIAYKSGKEHFCDEAHYKKSNASS